MGRRGGGVLNEEGQGRSNWKPSAATNAVPVYIGYLWGEDTTRDHRK
jgi:hypothetical protein